VTAAAKLPLLLNGPDNPLKLPVPLGDLHPHLIHGSLGPPEFSSKRARRSVQPFLHSSQYSVPLLYNWPLRFPQNDPFPLGIGAPSNTWYLGPTRVITQTASRSVQPFLCGSQMLCCTMHCQWERKPPKLPLPLEISLPAGG